MFWRWMWAFIINRFFIRSIVYWKTSQLTPVINSNLNDLRTRSPSILKLYSDESDDESMEISYPVSSEDLVIRQNQEAMKKFLIGKTQLLLTSKGIWDVIHTFLRLKNLFHRKWLAIRYWLYKCYNILAEKIY